MAPESSDDERYRERERKRHRKESHRDRDRSRSRPRGDRERASKRDEKDVRNGDQNSRMDRYGSRDRTRDRDRGKERDRDRHKDRHKEKKRRRSRSRDRRSNSREEDQHQDALPSHVTAALTDTDKDKQRKQQEVADLEDEAAKRRQRVALWQEQRRAAQQAEEAEAQKQEEAAESWTLEDDFDNEFGQVANRATAAQDLAEGSGEVDPLDAFMAENDRALEPAAGEDGEEIDPLDAFMAAEVAPAVRQDMQTAQSIKVEAAQDVKPDVKVTRLQRPPRRRPAYYSSDESSGDDDEDEEEESDDEAWAKNVTSGKLSKSDKLGQVDHSTIDYPPFRRNFYIEAQEIQMMTEKQVADYRLQLDDIKVRGRDVPRPVKNWAQCGLTGRTMDVMKKNGFTNPMPIQAQAIPVIMSGRDCIGIAMTGSGKTLAYVLPMLRHIKGQKPLERGDGPVGLIMGPTRELVHQIGRDIHKFSKAENLQCVTVYGGSGVADQITELKRGTEIVVATPGRFIDILVTSGGKITNLRRVTYLVLDEADRMFDMGFEPQINRIVGNIRPTRQTVMFSATFPKSVEAMARQTMQAPVEIQVGGRSVVNKDITQFVEIRQPHERFMRLLEILGNWQQEGKVLVFVHTQEQCDKLFRDLLQVSYGCLSLHGGKDQVDRESTINDFKNDVCSLLIATSIAARGLDVKDLVVVVNYDPPDHYEDYVHRVGRTGRAGNKGTAYTFICEEEDKYAPDLVKALRESNAPVPQDLIDMADNFKAKYKRGEAQLGPSGYGGHGFKFDAAEEEERDAGRRAAVQAANRRAGVDDSDDEAAEGVFAGEIRESQPQVIVADNVDLSATAKAGQAKAAEIARTFKMPANYQQNQLQNNQYLPNGELNPMVKAFQEAAQDLGKKHGIVSTAQPTSYRPMIPPGSQKFFELELNDFPQHARWKITHRETLALLNELTGAVVTTKGHYLPPGRALPEGERSIYLLIEGATDQIVRDAKRECKRILEESTERAMRRDAAQGGRYQI